MLAYCKRRARERMLVKIVAQRIYQRHGDLAYEVVRSRLIHLAQQGEPPEVKFWGEVHQILKDMS